MLKLFGLDFLVANGKHTLYIGVRVYVCMAVNGVCFWENSLKWHCVQELALINIRKTRFELIYRDG